MMAARVNEFRCRRAAGDAFSILFLKIAQRFNAGAMASTPDKSRLGTKGANGRNGVCEQSPILSSLTGLDFLLSLRTQR